MESTCCIAAVAPASECDVQGECLRLQQICLDALRYEALAWPKPGLVTPVDSGSHRDMNIGTLLASIDALRGSFAQLAAAGASARPFSVLQQIGIAAERNMLLATAGVNTHRGAIFNLGLLVAAAARRQHDATLHGLHCGEVVARVWGAEIAASRASSPVSHGSKVFEKYAAGGARAEAVGGFATLYNIGLPALRSSLAAGHDRESALLATLLVLMAHLPDTNLLWRGGEPGLEFVRDSAAAFNRAGGVATAGWRERLLALHREYVTRNLSPGGSADLMAACWVAHQLELNFACSLGLNLSQPPLAPARGMLAGTPQLCCDPASNRGGADCALPLSRGSWRGLGSNEQSAINFSAG